MAPFIGQPEGFSPETLDLLDKAMTGLWLEQVAIGAAMSGFKLTATGKISEYERSVPSPGKAQDLRARI